MSNITLNISLNDGRNVNLEVKGTDTWKNVKEAIQTSIETNKEKLTLLFASTLCKDEETLKDSHVSENSLVHCFIQKEEAIPIKKLQPSEAIQLVVNCCNASNRTNFEDYIMKLRSIDKISQLISECPEAINDPESLAAVLDPEMISNLAIDDGFQKLIEDKPVLGRLLQIVCTLVKSEEAPPRKNNVGSYALDELTDDDEEEEDMDIDQDASGRNSRHSNSQSRSVDFQPITPAQLAAALANATGSSSSQYTLSSAPRSGLPTPPSTSTPFNTPGLASSSVTGGASPGPSAAVPTEVFSQALQTALAASTRRGGTSNVSSEPSSSGEQSRDNANTRPQFLESMQLMREMGINDDNMTMEALRATNGDVQAAINLIFAQWMSED